MGEFIREKEEHIGIPFLVRTNHPTMRFPCALMREDNLKIIHVNNNEEYVQHLSDFMFVKNGSENNLRIQNNGLVIRYSNS